MLGLLEKGVVVIALARDASHAEWLRKNLKEKIMDMFITKGHPMEDPRLTSRADVLTKADGTSKKEEKADNKTPKKTKGDTAQPVIDFVSFSVAYVFLFVGTIGFACVF